MSSSQQARNKDLALMLENERSISKGLRADLAIALLNAAATEGKYQAQIERLRKLCMSESEAMWRARDEHICHAEECDACQSVFDGAILRLKAAGRGEG